MVGLMIIKNWLAVDRFSSKVDHENIKFIFVTLSIGRDENASHLITTYHFFKVIICHIFKNTNYNLINSFTLNRLSDLLHDERGFRMIKLGPSNLFLGLTETL